MKIKFWGTRGSIATPLPDRMKYGGDTSCVEVITASGEVIILDAGTGIRRLGQELISKRPEVTGGTLMLSHLHWDHIQGFPFFIPIYSPKYRWNVYGPYRVDVSLETRLKKQMSDLFFPVILEELSSKLEFHGIVEEDFDVGDTHIVPRFQHHPQGSYGYRIEDRGKVLAYCTDIEHDDHLVHDEMRQLCEGADVLIFDSQYTPEEYESKRGWGHSTWVVATRVAAACSVKQLVLFHHDPDHDDDFIDRMVDQARARFANTIAASRDLEIEL